jgi:hypothetical protein
LIGVVLAAAPLILEASPASASLAPTLSLSPTWGPAGTTLTATASGFQPAETVSVTYNSTGVGSCTTDGTGSCPVTLSVPNSVLGPYSVAASGTSSGLTATATFFETGQLSISLSATTGPVGSDVTATVGGFYPGEEVSFSYGSLLSFTSCQVQANLGCSVTVPVPDQPAGTYSLTAVGSESRATTSTSFTQTPVLEISPTTGPAGSTVEVWAEGFAPSESVTASFGGSVGSCTSNANGDCLTSLVVPAVPAGVYRIGAADASGDFGSSASTFTVTASINLNPTSGPAATEESAMVNGFEPGETVDVTYDSSLVGSCVAGSNGTCTVTFSIAALHAGNYAATATGSTSGLSANAKFNETPSFTVSATSGPPGSTFTASVLDFGAGDTVGFSFQGIQVASCLADANGDCSTTVVVPADPGGRYSLSANGSPSGDWATDGFFEITPTVALTPTSGPAGTSVGVVTTGLGLGEDVDFTFNGATVISCVTDQSGHCSATFTVPSEVAGPYIVSALGQTSGLSASATFTVTGPSITAISPNDGKLAGGTVVTITGYNFTSPATVHFGSTVATVVTVVSPTTIMATSPAGNATVDVTVETTNGISSTSPADQFSYLGTPTVTAVSPFVGPETGGSSVTIMGTGFAEPATVFFGSSVVSATVVNSTTITAVSPPGTGTIHVTVTTPGGTSTKTAADRFSYVASPVVSKVAPDTGPHGGGTVVTITGSHFTSPANVLFGGVPATNVTVVNSSKITATSPPGVGTVDVTVTSPNGTSATSLADQFTYLATGDIRGAI